MVEITDNDKLLLDSFKAGFVMGKRSLLPDPEKERLIEALPYPEKGRDYKISELALLNRRRAMNGMPPWIPCELVEFYEAKKKLEG